MGLVVFFLEMNYLKVQFRFLSIFEFSIYRRLDSIDWISEIKASSRRLCLLWSIDCDLKLQTSNGNGTEWNPIRSVSIRVITNE